MQSLNAHPSRTHDALRLAAGSAPESAVSTKQALRLLAIGVALGVLLTFIMVEIAGGWWEYRIFDTDRCTRNMSLGTTHVAPNQPNPCLFRTPRWSLFN